jgi:hypothetical protein
MPKMAKMDPIRALSRFAYDLLVAARQGRTEYEEVLGKPSTDEEWGATSDKLAALFPR